MFLPEGEGSEAKWADPIDFPSWEELSDPVTYTISLQEPLKNMSMTLTRGDQPDTIEMSGGRQSSISLDEDTYPNCTVDMEISAIVFIDTPTRLYGDATLTIERASGSYCPVFATPCDVIVGFVGATL